MTFEQYWNREKSAVLAGMPSGCPTPETMEMARDAALSAWDAAICAAQAALFEHGKPRPHSEICTSLSSLHTWN
jgi:hypothetical protein